MNPPNNLRQSLTYLDSLPAIPAIARKILSIKIATDEGERELFEVIEEDPPILAKVIGLSNSPMFGTSRKIFMLRDAVTLLGSKRVKMIAMSFAMMSSMARKPAGLFDVDGLWRHSLSITMIMDAMGKLMPDDLRPSDEEIYLAGLLHDIGFIVLDYLDPVLSDNLHARLASESGFATEEIEIEMLELNHCELGAGLGQHWNLPESIIAAIRHHHVTKVELENVWTPLIGMTSLAEKLLPTFDITASLQMDTIAGEWESLGIEAGMADKVIAIAQMSQGS